MNEKAKLELIRAVIDGNIISIQIGLQKIGEPVKLLVEVSLDPEKFPIMHAQAASEQKSEKKKKYKKPKT